MILKIQNIKDNIINIEEYTDKSTEVFDYDKILTFFISNIFCINQKLISFKDEKNNIIYTNSENSDVWNKNRYNMETMEVEVLGTIKKTKEEVFLEELDGFGLVTKLPDLSPKKVKENLNQFLKKEFGVNYKEITILYFAIYRDKEVLVEIKNEKKATAIIKLSEDIEKITKYITTKDFANQKKLAVVMKTTFVKEVFELDISSLKKYNTFFNSKIPLPGLYVYRLSYDFFESFFKKANLKK